MDPFHEIAWLRSAKSVTYTKKDGTVVSLEDIQAMKHEASEAYAQAIVKNAQAPALVGA